MLTGMTNADKFQDDLDVEAEAQAEDQDRIEDRRGDAAGERHVHRPFGIADTAQYA